jgi:hypothetical protein
MKRTLSIVALGAAMAALSSTAFAHSNVGFSVSIGVPGYVAPPAPVYYAPPPVVYAPPPVVYAPPPVYYGPPRVYYAPPAFGFYYGRPHPHRHWVRHR